MKFLYIRFTTEYQIPEQFASLYGMFSKSVHIFLSVLDKLELTGLNISWMN